MISRSQKILLAWFFLASAFIFWIMLECNWAGHPNISLSFFLLWLSLDILFLRGIDHVE